MHRLHLGAGHLALFFVLLRVLLVQGLDVGHLLHPVPVAGLVVVTSTLHGVGDGVTFCPEFDELLLLFGQGLIDRDIGSCAHRRCLRSGPEFRDGVPGFVVAEERSGFCHGFDFRAKRLCYQNDSEYFGIFKIFIFGYTALRESLMAPSQRSTPLRIPPSDS